MLSKSLMSDLGNMQYTITHMERERLPLSNNLAIAYSEYSRLTAYLQQQYDQNVHMQSAAILVNIQLVQANLQNYSQQYLATLDSYLDRILGQIKEFRDKKFMPLQVRIEAILFLSLRLLEFKYKRDLEYQSFDPNLPMMQATLNIITNLQRLTLAQINKTPGNLDDIIYAAFWLQDSTLLEIFAQLGIRCKNDQFIKQLLEVVSPDAIEIRDILQSFLNPMPAQVIPPVASIPEIVPIQLVQIEPPPAKPESVQIEVPKLAETVKPVTMKVETVTLLPKKSAWKFESVQVAKPAAKPEQVQIAVSEVAETVMSQSKKSAWTVVGAKGKIKLSKAYSNSSYLSDENGEEEVPLVKTKTVPVNLTSSVKEAHDKVPVTEPKSKELLSSPKVKKTSEQIAPAAVLKSESAPKQEQQPTLKALLNKAISKAVDDQDSVFLNLHLDKDQNISLIHAQLIRKFQNVDVNGVGAEFIRSLNLSLQSHLLLLKNPKAGNVLKAHALENILSISIEKFAKLNEKNDLVSPALDFVADCKVMRLSEMLQSKIAELEALNQSARDEIFTSLMNTRFGGSFEESKLKKIQGHVNQEGQTPLMVAIMRKLHLKTIMYLIDNSEGSILQQDKQRKNVIDYWVLYNVENLDYINPLWNKLWRECKVERIYHFLYSTGDNNGNTWLHHLVNRNVSENVVMDALCMISNLVKRDYLQAAAFTKNHLRQTPVFLLESKPDYWSEAIHALMVWVAQSAYLLSVSFKSAAPFFSQDSGFFNINKDPISPQNLADPIFTTINTNSVLRMSNIASSRYKLRSNLIAIFNAMRANGRDPHEFPEAQEKVIEYFDCSPDKMELVRVVGSENTLFGLIMDKIASANDPEFDALADYDIYKYIKQVLPVCESLVWKKAKHYSAGNTEILITEENIAELKSRVNIAIKQKCAIYIGDSSIVGQEEMFPLELALMEGNLPFVKFLCERCDAKVTNTTLLRALYLADQEFGELQEYILSKHSAGSSRHFAFLISADIYILEIYTKPSIKKVEWLMERHIYPTAPNARGDNLLHAVIHAIANKQLDIANFCNFIKVIARKLWIIEELMDWRNASGQDYKDLLDQYLAVKLLSEMQYKQIAVPLYVTRTSLEENEKTPEQDPNGQSKFDKLKL